MALIPRPLSEMRWTLPPVALRAPRSPSKPPPGRRLSSTARVVGTPINIEASYIVVEGFTVVGGAANFTLQSALAGYSTGNASLDGNGIGINTTSSVPLPNHITIENNTVYAGPGGGIYTEGADYVQILNNVVHNNANWSAFGNSGISVSTSANSDTNPGAHIIVSGNLVYDNAQLVPTIGNNTITDGEGIILDTNPNFVSEILVENNTVYGNGSSGIESFLTNNATVTGNTVFGNNTETVQSASNAEIFINQSNNNTVTNNTTASALSPDNTTIPAVAVEGSMYGAVGSSAEITKLTTEFLPPQVADALQHGFNPQVYASEALGLAFAFGNENGSSAFANAFGPANVSMPNSPAGDFSVRCGRGKHHLRVRFDREPRQCHRRICRKLGELLHQQWNPRTCKRKSSADRSCGPRCGLGRCRWRGAREQPWAITC